MAKATYLRVEWDNGSVWTAEGDTAEKVMEWYLGCELFCCTTRRFGYDGPQPTLMKKVAPMADKVEQCPNCEAERKRRVEAEASVEQLGGDLKAAQMDYANEHRLRVEAEAELDRSRYDESEFHSKLADKLKAESCPNCRNLESALEEARKEARMWEDRAKEGGLGLIFAERQRQIEVEGWNSKHDAEHDEGQLVAAAIAYAANAAGIPVKTKTVPPPNCGCRSAGECTHYLREPSWGDPWPWDAEWDKRKKHNEIRQLTIAAALIAAEIDRRLAAAPVTEKK